MAYVTLYAWRQKKHCVVNSSVSSIISCCLCRFIPLVSDQLTVLRRRVMALNSITKLSNEISECTKIITDYLESKGLEAPSFDVNGVAEYPIPPTAEAPFKARLKPIAATQELHDLALGPKESLRILAWGVCVRSSHEITPNN